MSLRWKYLIAVVAVIVTATAGFVVWESFAMAKQLGTGVHPLVLAGGLMMVLTVSLLASYSSLVVRRLRRIRDGAEQLAQGDHAHRIELKGSDEIATIANALNRMAENVAEAQTELERQVADRTEDLRAVLEEVHERSRIAEEVNRRLEEADRRKTEFLTNVSHELRTPLNSIVGFVRLLQDGMFEHEEERLEFLENTRQSASHLLHMVTDVLSVAQIEAGRLAVDRKALHAGDVIHDALRLMSVQYREKNVTVNFEVDGDVMVLADEAKLRQVLLNLVGNAIKFTDKGWITVRARACEDDVRFEVEDTGEGIPAKDLDRIFEKFHQVDSRTARHAGGTGLGLSICRDLVQIMDGTIGARSDGPGQGALFYFTLPAVASTPVGASNTT